MSHGKYWTAEEVFDGRVRVRVRVTLPLDEDTADMTDICLTSPPHSQMSLQSLSLMTFTCDISILL